MSKHIHAIMIRKDPDGPLIHCKVIEQELSPKGMSASDGLKLDLLMWWYYIRYSRPKYLIETGGFDSMGTFFQVHPECESFLKENSNHSVKT